MWVRILKFGTKLDSDELYYVTKNSHILLISPFICSFFFLSNGNFCHRFLCSFWSQCFQILCTLLGKQSVLCKWKLRCQSSFCLLFSIFFFFPSVTHIIHVHMDIFSVKDFSATMWVTVLKFCTKLDGDELYCLAKSSHILLISPFICSFFFLSNENFCHRFLGS